MIGTRFFFRPGRIAILVACGICGSAAQAGGLAFEPVSTEISTLSADIGVDATGQWTEARLENGGPEVRIGEPAVPSLRVVLRLPDGADAAAAHLAVRDSRWLNLERPVVPYAGEQALTETRAPSASPDARAYASDEAFPPQEVVLLSSFELSDGARYAVVQVNPLRYHAASGRMQWIRSARVTVDLRARCDDPSGLVRKRPALASLRAAADAARDGGGVLLMETGFAPAQLPSLSGSPVEYVIVSPPDEAMVAQWQRLADWKTACGHPALVVTSEWIDENYPSGCDQAERIRLFCRDAYVNWGLRWVLLGADPDLIPTRYIWHWDHEITAWRQVASDYYYASLEGTWDADRDGRFGEPDLGMVGDEPPSDDVDFTPRIHVGRVSAQSADDVSVWLGKYFDYTRTPSLDGYLDRDLLLGEVVFDAEWTRFGNAGHADCDMEECSAENCRETSNGAVICARTDGADYCIRVGNAITGTDCEHDQMYLFERTEYWAERMPAYPSELLTLDSTIEHINSGYQFVHHVGHADRDRWAIGGTRANVDDRLRVSDLGALTNGGAHHYFNAFVLNCNSAAIDYASIAESMLLMPGGGCVSYIGVVDADYPPLSDPISTDYYRFLFEAPGRTIGDGFFASIAANAPVGAMVHGASAKRFLAMTHVILGDPGLPVWWATPVQATVSFSATVPLGTSPLSVSVTDTGGPVSGALVCVQKADEVYAAVYTGPNGIAAVPFCPATTGDFDVTVTSFGHLPYTGSGRVVAATGDVVLIEDGIEILDDGTHSSAGNDNGAIETGETIRLSLGVRNRGQGAAEYVQGRLQLAPTAPDEVVTIIDGVATIGPLAAGSRGTDTEAFLIEIASDFVVGDFGEATLVRIPFTLGMQETGDPEFVTEVVLEVMRPALAVAPNTTVDEGGGTRDMYLGVQNHGRGTASKLVATLIPKNTHVNVVGSTSIDMDDVPSGTVGMAGPFTLQVSNEALARLDFSVTTMTDPPLVLHRRDIDLRKPQSPTNVVATGLPQAVDLTWTESTDPVSGIAGYFIFRAEGETGPFGPVLDEIMPGHCYLHDGGLGHLMQYRYVVQAMDASGNLSDSSDVVSAFTSPGMLAGWPNRFRLSTKSSPLVCELDGRWSTRREVIIGGDLVYAFHGDGSEVADGDHVGSTLGPFSSIGIDIWGKPASGDIDGDGQNELLAVSYTNKQLICYPPSGGTPKWRVTLPAPRTWFSPTLADLDRNDGGRLEVILTSGANNEAGIYVYEHDGSPMAGTSGGLLANLHGENLYHSPAVGDVDGDGALEVVMSTRAPSVPDRGAIWVINADGTSVPGFENGLTFQELDGLPQNTTGSPSLFDVDLDGKDEIYVVTPRRLWCIDDDGSLLWSHTFVQEFSLSERELLPEPALGDVDGDGTLDVAVAEAGERLYVWNAATGGLLAGFPVDLRGVPGQMYGSCIIANVDSDPLPDIVFGDEDKRIHAYRGDGTIPRGFPIVFAGSMLKQSLAAWDIDCDGKQNLIAQAEGALSIAVYDLDAPFNTLQPWLTNPWPMRYRDDRNTGRMIAEPPVGIQVTLSEPETDRDGWVTLRWTCPETVSGFRVQRMSREQGGWEPLATVPGHGAEGLQHYVYRDHPPAPGVFVYRVDPVRMDGTPQTGPTVEVTLGMYGARALAIQRALPDPLPQGGVASISFSLPGSGSGSVPVALHVHDVLGRSVRTLADDARPSGFYTVYWDGRDAAGRLLPTGVYVIRLESRGRIASARMLVVR